jgi:hypothetical protein
MGSGTNSDEFDLMDASPTPPAQPSVHPLWSVHKDGSLVSCVLQYHRGPHGVEAQIFFDGDMRLARRFNTKEEAVRWAAQLERVAERQS